MSDEIECIVPIVPEDLAELGIEPRLIPFAVSTILHAEQLPNDPQLSSAEARNLVEILDKVVSSAAADTGLKDRCSRVLRQVSAAHCILPQSYFPPGVTPSGTTPYTSGGFTDIWEGQQDGNHMCVKAFRALQDPALCRIKRGFYPEILGWKCISHPNVLPFLGVSETLFRLCFISPWLQNGNVIEYARENRKINRLHLLAQVACGLEYLHSLDIVHGSIHPGNILITNDGTACLGDFGIMSIITNPAIVDPGSLIKPNPKATRYTAPELLNPSKFNLTYASPSRESDIYSLAMTAYETLTEILPYGNSRDSVIIFHIVAGNRPPRPTDTQSLQDQIWNMITTCWSDKPEQRLAIHVVYDQLLASGIQEITDVGQDARPIARPLEAGTGVPPKDTPPASLPVWVDGCCAPFIGDPPGHSMHEQIYPITRIVFKESQQTIPTTTIHKLSTSTLLRRIAHWDGNSLPEMCQVLDSALEAQDYHDHIRDLNGQNIDPQLYINSLDQIIGTLPLDSDLWKRSICALKKICVLSRLLPASYAFAPIMGEPGARPSASGEFSNVWKLTDETGRVFAAKSLYISQCVPIEELHKRFCTEVILGKHINHPNILSIKGVLPHLSQFCAVSEWMVNGDVLQYITKCPGVNHLELLLGITRGLDYLHKSGIIHKNLRCTNILIDGMGSPRLHICNVRGQISRYLAPEHYKLGVKKEKMTAKCDMYSLSMVTVALVTRSTPFPKLTNFNVMIQVSDGLRPERPRHFEAPGLTPEVWEIAEMCWHEDPKKRPDAHTVLRHLEDLASSGTRTYIRTHTSAEGLLAGVRKGTYNGREVAIKSIRGGTPADNVACLKRNRRFCQEVALWMSLNHPNILRLIGICRWDNTPDTRLATISEWMPNGNIVEYIQHNDSRRMELLVDCAQGMGHLHGVDLVHGDLKGANILITSDSPVRACLADFGFLTIVYDDASELKSTSTLGGGTIPFAAPELLSAFMSGKTKCQPSKETDVYAFGMVILQVLTGQTPFHALRDIDIPHKVVQGGRPATPANASDLGISDEILQLLARCWHADCDKRPRINEVLQNLCGEPARGLVFPPSKLSQAPSGDGSLDSETREYAGIFPTRNAPTPTGEHPPFLARASRISNCTFGDTSLAILFGSQDTRQPYDKETEPSQELINNMDKGEDGEVPLKDQPKFLNKLGKMCSQLKTLPDSIRIENYSDGPTVEDHGGGCATVSRGEFHGRPVAIKTLHQYLTHDPEERFCKFRREVVAWRHLQHPNILPFIGVILEPYRLAMVSEWMDHGNINEYIKHREGINRAQLLVDVASGLEYMHDVHMVHGDLKGANILINQSSRACLADFGLSTIVSTERLATTSTSSISKASTTSLMSFTSGGTTRWMSPELLNPDLFGITDCRPTKQSDCYALGMVVYEVLCGNVPFWDITNTGVVMIRIMRGDRPGRPEGVEGLGFTKGLWEIIERCWLADASGRPDVKDVLSQLSHAAWSWDRKRLV